MAVQLVPISGTYRRPDGTPAAGSVRFTIADRLNLADGTVIYPGGTVEVALGSETGAVHISLPANDDPQLVQQGYQVLVEERLLDGSGRTFTIETPTSAAAGGLHLGDVLVPPGLPTPSPVYAKGVPGGVAGLNADGEVVNADGEVLSAAAPATTSARGAVKLAGDLAGTADSPTVPALAKRVPLWQPATAYTAGQTVLNPSGELVKALTGFTSGSSYDATKWSAPGSATYPTRGSLSFGRRVAFMGDSITVGTGASSAGLGYVNQSTRIAGSARAAPTVNGGVAGERSDQIVGRLPAVLAGTALDHVHFQMGTNDASQLVPLATYQANVTEGVRLARLAGCSVSIGLVPPRGPAATTAIDTLIRSYNLWLRLWAPKQGIPVADTYTPLCDPTTGRLNATALGTDDTHPSNAGHLLMARAVGPALIAGQLVSPWPVTAVSPIGLVSNPLMNGTTGWTDQGGTGTATVGTAVAVPGDGLPAGAWLTMRIDNTAGGGSVNRQRATVLDAAQYAAGDVLAVFAYLKSTDTTGAASAKLQVTNNAVAFSVVLDTVSSVNDPGPILSTFAVPATPNTLRLGLVLSVPAGMDITASLGAVQVYNLTTGGLVGIV